MGIDHPAYTLGALSAAGGLLGYLRKGSVVSLVAGLAVGGVYGYSGYLLHENRDYGIQLALAASSVLLGAGIVRGLPSRFTKPVPVVLTVLGALGSTYYWRQYSAFYLE